MATVKNAVYQVDNGTDFDEIHFRTKAAQVTLQDTSNYFVANNIEDAMKELFQNVSNGKNLVATAITGKGVNTSGNDTFQVIANNINAISTGKKWASGTTVPVSANYSTYAYTTTGSSSGYVSTNLMIKVSSLGFKPSSIIIYDKKNYTFLFVYNSDNVLNSKVYGYFNYNITYTAVEVLNSITLNVPYVVNGEFQLPIRQDAPSSIYWVAYE